MLLPLFYSLYRGDGQFAAFLVSAVLVFVCGLALWLPNRGKRQLHKRDIYLIVTGGWVLLSLMGALPYLFGGAIPQLANAFFESVSGFTTTGASVLTAIEVQPESILLWRSLTQWIGGMGIVVLMIAVMPLLGIGGMQLFNAESPGVTVDKLTPRIKETAGIMWVVYVVLTFALGFFLWLGGMSVFDAINHAFTTLSTGGFSTKQASMAAFAPHLQYIVIFFMFLAGTSFALLYTALFTKITALFRNDEFRYYVYVVVGATLVLWLFGVTLGTGIEHAFRDALFQVVSIVTTTGFATADYYVWAAPMVYILFILMFVGGMTGSTAGGVKVMRHLVLFKDAFLEFRKQLHPDAILPVRFNGKLVPQSVLYRVIAFVMLYIFIAVVSVVVLLLFGIDTPTSFGAVAATLGNIGPGLGEVGPVGDYSQLPDLVKWYLSGLMIVGRLELFTVLMLFTPYFWRRY